MSAGLIFGVCRDTVTAESANLMFVNRADPAVTRVDVIFLVVGGIRWGEKGFEITDEIKRDGVLFLYGFEF